MTQNIDFLARAWVLSKTVGTITNTDNQVIICKTNKKIVRIQESILHSPIVNISRQNWLRFCWCGNRTGNIATNFVAISFISATKILIFLLFGCDICQYRKKFVRNMKFFEHFLWYLLISQPKSKKSKNFGWANDRNM